MDTLGTKFVVLGTTGNLYSININTKEKTTMASKVELLFGDPLNGIFYVNEGRDLIKIDSFNSLSGFINLN